MCRPRILIVDDDKVIIKFLRANIKAEGWETLTAMDGAEALQTIERELPDLVILDIMMPKVDGFEVLRRLREWSQIPIIDGTGQPVARLGDIITVGGGEVPARVVEGAIEQRLPDDCEGPFWLIGEVVENKGTP